MSASKVLRALVEKRERRACWFYALWLAGYGLLALIITVYAAVLGQDYRWPLFVLLVPAMAGCAQLRFPTLLGWVVLFSATALVGVVAGCVFPWLVKGALGTADWWQVLVGALLLAAIGAVLLGLVRYRPFPKTRPAESGRRENRLPGS